LELLRGNTAYVQATPLEKVRQQRQMYVF